MRLIFGAGGGAGLGVSVGVVPILLAPHHHDFVGYGARVNRQSVDVADRAQSRGELRLDIELEQAGHLPIAVLLDYINTIVPGYEVVHLDRKSTRLNSSHLG